MASLVAIYDASVLYSAPVRDLLMHLATTGLFRARWTDAIHDEWIGSLLEHRPDVTAERLQRTRRLMDASVRDCLVTGYEDLIPTLALLDPDDRHVLAAAIRSEASVIVTCDLGHFPAKVLQMYGIEAQHPDQFVLQLFDVDPRTVGDAARRHRQNLRNPPKSVEEYLATLERNGLAQTVGRLRSLVDVI